MLECQKQFASYIESLSKLLAGSGFTNDRDLLGKVTQTELLVPVIGAFSAGKSTLLNTFMGTDVLPVGIAPETELATELRYSPEPYLIAITASGEEKRFPVDALVSINQRSSEFLYLCLYLDSAPLKRIAPLVLVDMPGYGSSLESHNKALLYYLPRGSHFVVVTSVEDGNLTQSMLRRLDEVKTYAAEFTFVLSKCNLKGPQQVQAVVEYVDEQLAVHFGPDHKSVPVGKSDAEPLTRAFEAIDPEELFPRLFIEVLRDENINLIAQVNLAVRAAGRTGAENEGLLRELEAGLAALEAKKEGLGTELRDRYSGRMLTRCLKAIDDDLDAATDELVGLVAGGNSAALGNAVSEIVRATLSRNIQAEMEGASSLLIEEMAQSLSSLGASMAALNPREDWAAAVSDKAKTSLAMATNVMSKWADHMASRQVSTRAKTRLAQGIGSILAVGTGVVAPLLEAIIVFLPDLLQKINAGRERQRIRESLQSQVFLGIKAEVRAKLPEILHEQLAVMLGRVNKSFEGQISKQRDIIDAQRQERAEHGARAEENVKALETLSRALKALASQYLYV